jgi:dolichyl-phosphate beta-glucosyltransferase
MSQTRAREPSPYAAAVPPVWLSAVVPAYNEAASIADTLTRLRAALEATGHAWEIVVVDNASTDGTAEQVPSDVRLLRNDVNRGKGFSVRRGMLAAQGDLRLHCDADCAPSLESLPVMLAALEDGADVVVGSRLAPGAHVGRRQPLRRRIAGRTFVELSRLALSEPTHDLFCGFKLWRADAAVAAYSRLRLDGWVFDAEVLALARALGYRLREVGIAWSDREGSRLSMPRVIVPVVRDLLAARAHVRREAERAAPAPAADPAG